MKRRDGMDACANRSSPPGCQGAEAPVGLSSTGRAVGCTAGPSKAPGEQERVASGGAGRRDRRVHSRAAGVLLRGRGPRPEPLFVGRALGSGVAAARQAPPESLTPCGTRGERGRTWMPPSRVGSAHRARGEAANRRLSCPAASTSVTLGARPREDQASGSAGAGIRPQASHALGKRPRGHRPWRTGTPSTGGRATA
jgi:hypothetical protein